MQGVFRAIIFVEEEVGRSDFVGVCDEWLRMV